MWFYRGMPILSTVATRAYYRVTVAGPALPATGPVLVVANHNNSLVDPALVSATSNRPVRYLAKAPLVYHPLIGWLIRGVGSVPVYRVKDDPTLVAQNIDSFRDAHRVLAAGDVIGIFPEGVSHSASRLAPLKTGAARIALGAAAAFGRDFPIVAVGLVFRDRNTFRSEAHVIYGEPFAWGDLVGDESDRGAVRELTARIEHAMRRVSVNMERWEDEPIVRTAESVWRAEFGADRTPTGEVARLRITTEALRLLREAHAGEHAAAAGEQMSSQAVPWRETALELKAHGRALRKLGLEPEHLVHTVTSGEAVRWAITRLPLVFLLPIPVLGAVFFWLPTRVTTALGDFVASKEGDDAKVTYRLLAGLLFFPLWMAATSVAVGLRWGWLVGLLSAVLQPLWAWGTLLMRERREAAVTAIRRYLLRRVIGDRLTPMRERQRALAERIRTLLAHTAVAS